MRPPVQPGRAMSGGRLDHILAALADPARRQVIELLLRTPRRAGELAAALGLSAPRMSQHLRVLRSSGLIEDAGLSEDARVSVYRLRRASLSALRRWVESMTTRGPARLSSKARAGHGRSRRHR